MRKLEKWKQQLELYLTATESDEKSDKIQSSILLTCIGEKGREIYNTFSFTDESHKLKFRQIIKQFDEYCTPRKNITYLRHKFFTQRQKEGQSFDEFATLLRKLAQDCEFETLKSSLIRDVIVIGVSNNRLRERMLREPKLSLEQAISFGQTAEETTKHVKELQQEDDLRIARITHKSKPYSSKPNRNWNSNENKRTHNTPSSTTSSSSSSKSHHEDMINQCKFCSYAHRRGSCPAYKQTCHNCGKNGHFSKCCRSKPVNTITNESDTDSDDSFFIGAIFAENIIADNSPNPEPKQNADQNITEIHSVGGAQHDDWTVIFNTNGTDIEYKVDTGAQVNVLPVKDYHRIRRKPKLLSTNTKLTAYNGSEIPVQGKCIAYIKRNGKNIPLLFIVSNTNSPPIHGLQSSEKLNLINRVMAINSETDFKHEYSDCFGELGTLPKTHHITLNKEVPPVIHAARSVPFSIHTKLKDELSRMVKLEVIEPVEGPSDWVSSLVIVEKPNGKLRICLDPKDLNRAIKRHHLKLPTAEEIFANMKDAKYFTKLDASNG